MTDAVTRAQLELKWNEHAMYRNPLWFRLRSEHRLYCHYRKELVVWRASSATPEVLQVYQVADFRLSPVTGLSFVLAPLRGDHKLGRGDVTVTHTPIELPEGNIFVWISAFCNLQFTPELYEQGGSARSLNLPFMIKTVSHPLRDLKEGGVYMHSMSDFRVHFPGVEI